MNHGPVWILSFLIAVQVTPLVAQEAEGDSAASAPEETPAPAEPVTTLAEPAPAEPVAAPAESVAAPAESVAAPAESVAAPAEPAPAPAEPAAETPGPAPAAAVALPATNEPAATPTPATPDPRLGDRPGWWFQAALRTQPRGYPAFLGVRFADATRAVLIEVPVRSLEPGRALDYQVWACNDLPGPLDCRVSCRVERNGALVATDPPAALRVKGGTPQAAVRARHATGGWEPGEYVIRAALCDTAGAILHRNAETVTLTSAATD